MKPQLTKPTKTRAELREMMELVLNQYQLSPQEAAEIADSFVDVFEMYAESS